ncbi:hypothetical protein L1049_006099 [Liquidambar formosana]|uniref:ZF-HD dimerization-type domain-containing protein n=1 Tax=Liquidambar formosana TaxID=63359 RepID=A0AAP0WR18_LIQFO
MDLTKASPDPETETPPHTQPNHNKSLTFTNGTLKRHHHQIAAPAVLVVVSHKECLKNHAASLGGHALDGCGEFMPSSTATPTDPTSLKCAACGCHRNFHRRDSDEPPTTTTTHFHHLHHHHHPPPPPLPFRRSSISPSTSPSPSPSPSPPLPRPPPSSFYSSAPHMLLALSTGVSGASDDYPPVNPAAATKTENPNGRKRFRTKFTHEQKEKMHGFAERLGWKMQKSDEGLVEEFCNEIGVGKGVLKVWMHNNKHTLGKRYMNYSNGDNHDNGDSRISFDTNGHNNNGNGSNTDNGHHNHHHNEGAPSVHLHVSTNGSSSSS